MAKISALFIFTSLTFMAITFAKATMINNPFHFNTEEQLTDNFNAAINRFWEENAQSNRFLGNHNKEIYTVSLRTGNRNAIVISQGRNESTLKYKELAFELNRQGYDLYLIDHRGQGFSQRLGGDQYRGHIQKFQDYVDDFQHYVSSLKLPQHYQNRYLLSHSMGSTISALYLQQFTHPFQAAVFISPMLSINLGWIPNSLAKVISASSAEICRYFYKKACYIFGGQGYKKIEFANNELTSSQLRFNSAFNTFEQYPETQLGSPTMRWVSESLLAIEQAISNADKINIPIILIQAGADTVVTSNGQEQFFRNLNAGKAHQFLKITDAKHELILERDQYRLPALTTALQFLEQSQQKK